MLSTAVSFNQRLIVRPALVLGVPSAYQQKRIKELNSTLQREQLEGMQLKDRMIMVSVKTILSKGDKSAKMQTITYFHLKFIEK